MLSVIFRVLVNLRFRILFAALLDFVTRPPFSFSPVLFPPLSSSSFSSPTLLRDLRFCYIGRFVSHPWLICTLTLKSFFPLLVMASLSPVVAALHSLGPFVRYSAIDIPTCPVVNMLVQVFTSRHSRAFLPSLFVFPSIHSSSQCSLHYPPSPSFFFLHLLLAPTSWSLLLSIRWFGLRYGYYPRKFRFSS